MYILSWTQLYPAMRCPAHGRGLCAGCRSSHYQYHEPFEKLPEETRTFARLIMSLIEEAEAINWYEQRMAVEADEEAQQVMAHAQKEEFIHFGMGLEYLHEGTLHGEPLYETSSLKKVTWWNWQNIRKKQSQMNKDDEWMVHMKNFVGGVFKNKGNVEMARKALRENGFDETSLNLLECTHDREAVVLKENPRIQSIAVAALIGALTLGAVGGVLGLLVGLDIIRLPSLEPAGGATLPFEVTWQYTLTSLATGLIFGGITGAILGVATRLASARYKKVDTPQVADKGDLMLAVEANDMRRETKARSIMKEYGAIRLEEFRNAWDTEVWSVFDEEISQAG